MTSVEPFIDPDGRLPNRFMRWIETLRAKLRPIPDFHVGDGSPEGVVTAPQGARYFNRTGGAGTWLYVKTTTTGNAGWVAYG